MVTFLRVVITVFWAFICLPNCNLLEGEDGGKKSVDFVSKIGYKGYERLVIAVMAYSPLRLYLRTSLWST